jgi:hypothetical protein
MLVIARKRAVDVKASVDLRQGDVQALELRGRALSLV